jgi:ferric-dicitrate binding protein FerR (iron transport regulator)
MESKNNHSAMDELIAGYLNGELTADQKEELITWIRQSKTNKRYFDEYAEIWITAKATGENSKYDDQKAFLHFKNQINKGKKITHFSSKHFLTPYWRIAAIFILAFSIGGIIFFNLGKKQWNYSKLDHNEIIVPRGGRAQFILNDGTKVILNAESKLRIGNHYGITDREVELEGEGYFEVAKDKSKPFIVNTSYIKVRALGTEFNVKAYPSDKTIETTLVEGSVKVENNNTKKTVGSVILRPNQKITFYKDDAAFMEESVIKKQNKGHSKQSQKSTIVLPIRGVVAENVNVESLVSWKENRWIIEKQTLSNLAKDMERKFDIHIRFESEKLKDFRFTGTLFDESLEQVLQVMSYSAPINCKIKGKEVIITEKANFEEIYQKLYQGKKK